MREKKTILSNPCYKYNPHQQVNKHDSMKLQNNKKCNINTNTTKESTKYAAYNSTDKPVLTNIMNKISAG